MVRFIGISVVIMIIMISSLHHSPPARVVRSELCWLNDCS